MSHRIDLFEAARRDPRLLLLRCDDGLQTSLERDTASAARDSRFHVRVRGRTIFSGPYEAARARYERAWEAQHLRRMAGRDRAPRPQRLSPPAGIRVLPSARRPEGGYAGRRRLSWRSLVPLASPPLPPSRPLLIPVRQRHAEGDPD